MMRGSYWILLMILSFTILSISSRAADIVAVSQLGYHPNSVKQVVVYTGSGNGNLNIKDFQKNEIVGTFPLHKPLDFNGNAVNCQGNLPCLVGDFSDFKKEGKFYIEVNGINSHDFVISKNVYSDAIPTFLEFYNAMLQQNSAYHNDLHSNYQPGFSSIADGSFIMEANQAALPLIRMGSSYRRNPSLFQVDNYNILSAGKPDMQEYILSYVKYLEGLQGVVVKEDSSENAIRLGTGVKIEYAFVPGPTNLTNISVYIPGSPPVFSEVVPVISLCGPYNSTAEWKKCIDDAANYYKCQIDEPCLQISYIDKKGIATSNSNGFAVSKGWGYEFGCFFDVNLNAEMFNTKPNPCMVFYADSSREYTAMALLAFLEALPAVKDYSNDEGNSLLKRSVDTYNYIKANYPQFSSGDSDSGFYGASLFLLYDYTGDANYLQEGYNARNSVSTQLISDGTRGNEFYWEEYSKHRDAIKAAGLDYQINGINPEEIFRGKIFKDYKDNGQFSISSNGERVFQFDNNIQFQNSRFILTEGLIAAKTAERDQQAEPFIPSVADSQLSWLTGMNAVQQGTALDSPLKSMSFIFGIGDYPKQFHSRWLVDTGYSAASNNDIIGARGTNYQFLDTITKSVTVANAKPEDYVYFDGKFNMIGYNLGSLGNKWRNETNVDPFVIGKTFKNGKTYIPGWINGAFDANADPDVIFNYNDNLHAYEYTESTNEIVATALELLSYLDNLHNNINISITKINNTGNDTSQNNTLIDLNSSLTIFTTPSLADVFINLTYAGTTNSNGVLNVQLAPGYYQLMSAKDGYTLYGTFITLNSGENITLNIILEPNNSSPASSNSTAKITKSSTNLQKISSSPNGADYYMREDSNASFTVISNTSNKIQWFVDDAFVSSDEGNQLTFNWTPGILWAPRPPYFSNIDFASIKAVSPTENVTWNVDVENVINPFFSGIDGASDTVGSPDAQVHVFTNNKLVTFTDVNVSIQSLEGGSLVNIIYSLDKSFVGNNETEWKKSIFDMPYGDNFLFKIIGFNNITKNTLVYELGDVRSHYRNFPQNSNPAVNENRNQNPPEEDSASNGAAGILPPQLVYVTFGKDVVGLNDTQTITLDAKNFNGGIQRVEATILPPSGPTKTIKLQLIRGNNDYGTWSAEFGGFITGLYSIYSIGLGVDNTSSMNEIHVQNRSFYVVGETVSSREHLMLVYSILSNSSVKNGTDISFRIDARDTEGIISATAKIENSRAKEFIIPLKLVNGDKNYGTWEGIFKAAEPDSTYSVTTVTLANLNQKKDYEIKDRSVYIFQSNSTSLNYGNGITGLATGPYYKKALNNIFKEPLAPTLVGFGLMFLVIGSSIISQKIGKRAKSRITISRLEKKELTQ